MFNELRVEGSNLVGCSSGLCRRVTAMTGTYDHDVSIPSPSSAATPLLFASYHDTRSHAATQPPVRRRRPSPSQTLWISRNINFKLTQYGSTYFQASACLLLCPRWSSRCHSPGVQTPGVMLTSRPHGYPRNGTYTYPLVCSAVVVFIV